MLVVRHQVRCTITQTQYWNILLFYHLTDRDIISERI